MDLLVMARSAGQAEHDIGDVLGTSTHPIVLHLDSPELIGNQASTPSRGILTVSGWAIAQGGIDRVEVWLGEQKLGNAYLGVRREDIGMAYPEYDGALLSGFAMVVPHRAVPAGDHNVRVIVHAKSGRSTDCSFQLLSKPPDTADVGNLRDVCASSRDGPNASPFWRPRGNAPAMLCWFAPSAKTGLADRRFERHWIACGSRPILIGKLSFGSQTQRHPLQLWMLSWRNTCGFIRHWSYRLGCLRNLAAKCCCPRSWQAIV